MERNFMSKYIDCTMPFYDYMPVGNVWAWDVPFRTEPITTHEKNSYELWMITMHSETGTRLMIKAMQDPNAPTVDRLPLISASAIEVAKECPNVTIIGSDIRARPLLKGIREVGPDRICFGSDTPFEVMRAEVAKYKALLQGVVGEDVFA